MPQATTMSAGHDAFRKICSAADSRCEAFLDANGAGRFYSAARAYGVVTVDVMAPFVLLPNKVEAQPFAGDLFLVQSEKDTQRSA